MRSEEKDGESTERAGAAIVWAVDTPTLIIEDSGREGGLTRRDSSDSNIKSEASPDIVSRGDGRDREASSSVTFLAKREATAIGPDA
jgi:hypothetical protein